MTSSGAGAGTGAGAGAVFSGVEASLRITSMSRGFQSAVAAVPVVWLVVSPAVVPVEVWLVVSPAVVPVLLLVVSPAVVTMAASSDSECPDDSESTVVCPLPPRSRRGDAACASAASFFPP